MDRSWIPAYAGMMGWGIYMDEYGLCAQPCGYCLEASMTGREIRRIVDGVGVVLFHPRL